VVTSAIYDLDGQDLVANPVVQKFLNGVPPGLGITFAVAAINAVGEGPATRATPVFTTTPPAVTPVDPGRLMDTRSDGTTVDSLVQGQGVRAAGSVTPLKVLGRGGVASDATAVALNVTVTEAQAPGYLTVYPCGGDPPTASSVNYVAGSTIPNLVVSKVGADGQVCIFTQSPVQLLADVNGFFNANSGLVPVVPARLLDTRKGSPTVDGVSAGGGRAAAGSVTEFQVTGRANVPADASAAVLNVTATNEAADGFVTVYPCGQAPPNASNLNFSAGQTIANAVVSKIGALGKVCVFNQTATDLVVDLNGYFPATSPLTPLPPARLMDTRPGFVTVDGQAQAIGTRAADSVTELKVNGRGGVPNTSEAVALNVTVTGSAGPGFLTIYPCGTTRPTASNVNFSAGQTIPNAVLAKIGPNGTICIYTQTAADVIVDVNAAFS
ncbi:MAG: hypothetical protein JWN39_4221, partial [Ilumatobacteraceae bacterium]|nr:hypothetical protein [Ilumatobacteraceae bacterium]